MNSSAQGARDLLLDTEWGPVSRRGYDFYATDEEIQALIVHGLGAATTDWRLVGVDFGIGPYDFPADELGRNVIRPDGQRRTEFRLWDQGTLPGFSEVLGRIPHRDHRLPIAMSK